MTRLMGELIGYADQITSYGFSSTDLGNKAAGILKQLNVTQVSYPDISTKEKAHQAIGLVEADLIKEKQKFIENDVKKHWQPVSQYGY
ncbi:hypothetical protein [Shewanella xiamenensis]|uniref:Uncharacterized protein n=1 Tax=Shewanella xiamenensis TaxID=332186 RepID=A0AAE4Q1B4_9GAMM|nr:hypothetical protein [Shewanella xiamenensis]MDV5390949.1 hypothetical protein [Shewanella xiamenensis]MDV5393337.1 hypothetical protein [Shewanella xiamenensis]